MVRIWALAWLAGCQGPVIAVLGDPVVEDPDSDVDTDVDTDGPDTGAPVDGPFACTLPTTGWPVTYADAGNRGLARVRVRDLQGRVAWTFGPAAKVLALTDHTRPTPTVGPDGTIYVPGWDGRSLVSGKPHLYAVTPEGALKWKAPLTRLPPVYGATVCAEGHVLLISGDALVAFAVDDGHELGRVALNQPLLAGPVPGPGFVVLGYGGNSTGQGGVLAVAPDGSVRWDHALGQPVEALPAIRTDGTVAVVPAYGADLVVLDRDGDEIWRAAPGYASGGRAGPAPVALDDGAVLFTDFVGVSRLEADGAPAWRFADDSLGYFPATPSVLIDGAIVAPLVYDTWTLTLEGHGGVRWTADPGVKDSGLTSIALGGDGSGVYGSFYETGTVRAVSESGGELWSLPVGAVYRGPALVGGRVYVTTEAGDLVAIE